MKCDMKDTLLCKHYQKRYACMYGNAHNVDECPYGQLEYYKRHVTKASPEEVRENIIERDKELLEKLNTGSKKIHDSNIKVEP